jgi:hypothetical protein
MAAEAGHMSEALDQLRQLLDVEPTFIPAHMLLIQLNLQTDSPIEDAQRVFQLIKTVRTRSQGAPGSSLCRKVETVHDGWKMHPDGS